MEVRGENYQLRRKKKKEKSKIFIGDGRTLHSNFVIVVDVYVLVTKTHSLFKKQHNNRQALSETFVTAYNKLIILYELLLKQFCQTPRQLIIFVPPCPDIFLHRKSRGIYKKVKKKKKEVCISIENNTAIVDCTCTIAFLKTTQFYAPLFRTFIYLLRHFSVTAPVTEL